jgi:hypothetical protein
VVSSISLARRLLRPLLSRTTVRQKFHVKRTVSSPLVRKVALLGIARSGVAFHTMAGF